jgi:transcriptional regulator with XRE-family HTH domain
MRAYRKMRGLTQAELAEKIGVMRHHVTEMETGKRSVSKSVALKLAKLFSVSVDRFISDLKNCGATTP